MESVTILNFIQNKLPKDPTLLAQLGERLNALDEERRKVFFTKVTVAKLSNPAFTFWIGTFWLGLFAVGRFMIGDYWQGIIRLLLFFVPLVVLVFLMVANANDMGAAFGALAITIIIFLLSYVLWFIDLFLIGKKTRKKNYQKVLEILQNS